MIKGKLKIVALTVSAVCAVAVLSACTKTEPCEVHKWDSGTVSVAATCGEKGVTKYTCTVCGETKEEHNIAATGQHSGSECSVCGYVDMSEMTKEDAIAQYGYYHVDVDESNTVTVNDKIYFGSYPQTKVTDSTLLQTLNGLTNANAWESYGYYVEDTASDCMYYQDVAENGTKYRAVKIDDYRPSHSSSASSQNYIQSNGFTKGNVYWFEYSAIEWRVLDYVDGEGFLNSVKSIDSQAYLNTFVKDGTTYYSDSAKTTYANGWENSDIRSWLNGSFFNWAFSSAEQGKIATQTLDNVTTGYDATQTYTKDQNSTQDKVFLLSYRDILNVDYGFPAGVTGTGHESLLDVSVCKTGTDYALSQGIRTSVQSANADGDPCSWWMLRSAGGKSYSICGVDKYGTLSKSNTTSVTGEDAVVNCTNSGISPAIKIKIGK